MVFRPLVVAYTCGATNQSKTFRVKASDVLFLYFDLFYSSTMKHYSKYIITSLLALFVVVSVLSRWYHAKPTPETETVVEEQHYYVITADCGKDSLYAYVSAYGDTLIASPNDSLFLRTITRTLPASWVNRWWWPSCFGLVACKTDSARYVLPDVHKDSRAMLNSVYRAACIATNERRKQYVSQLEDIDYYLNTHGLQDEGFDVVLRHRDVVTHSIDSIDVILKHVRNIGYDAAKSTPHVALRSKYYVVFDSTRHEAAQRDEVRDGYVMYRLLRKRTPQGARPVYLYADSLGKADCKAAPVPRVTYSVEHYEGQYVRVDTLADNVRKTIGESSDSLLRHGFGVGFDDKVRAGMWEYGVYKGEQPVYTSNHVYGIDISRYQHEPSSAKTVTRVQKVKVGKRWVKKRVKVKVSYPIAWDKLRITSLGTKSKKKVDGEVDYPISFIYIKSTEGVSVLNNYYLGDYKQARSHGFRVGTYHFFSTRRSAASQVMFFLKNSRYDAGRDLPPVLDLEPTTAQINAMGGPTAMLASARKWLELVERYRGVRPILYVSQTFVNRYFVDKYKDGVYLKKNYNVWIARYGEYKPDVRLSFWQLSPDGRVRGITGHVDINIFNGYADSFKAFCERK